MKNETTRAGRRRWLACAAVAGAGALMASPALARARPDGYTIGMGTISTLNVNPVLQPGNKLDPLTCGARQAPAFRPGKDSAGREAALY